MGKGGYNGGSSLTPRGRVRWKPREPKPSVVSTLQAEADERGVTLPTDMKVRRKGEPPTMRIFDRRKPK